MIYSENDEGISQTCTGTLISTSAILTAAHCVTKNLAKNSAFFSPNPFEDDNPQSLSLTKVIIHEHYLKANELGRNDLAILHFAGGLPEGAALAQIDRVVQVFAVASAITDPGNLDPDACHYRSIFTNIEFYTDWIQSNLRQS